MFNISKSRGLTSVIKFLGGGGEQARGREGHCCLILSSLTTLENVEEEGEGG